METVNQETTQETRTFTQDEVNQMIGERLGRERAKYADYEELKEKATKFDEAEEASKSELQKATERADALQKKLDDLTTQAKVRDIRDKVAKETGVPANLLTADTEEACKLIAQNILEFKNNSSVAPVIKDGGEVLTSSKRTTREEFAEFLKNNLK